MKALTCLALAWLALTACGSAGPGPKPAGGPLTQAELKYRILDAYGQPFVCGPPVARQPDTSADDTFPTIQADTETYQAIIAHAHPPGDPSKPEFRQAVYREWQRLNAVTLLPKDDHYTFAEPTANGFMVTGEIDRYGNMSSVHQAKMAPMCPICLPAGALIAAPGGALPVTQIRVGTLVWTVGARGERVSAPVLKVGSVPMPLGHDAVRLQLADGRVVTASANHPTADGRRLGDLAVGSSLDGSLVVERSQVHLEDGATYDLLPAGPTGAYWADGVLLGSTLR
jgi:hypothetical protein